jgi:hypothetical protein
MSLDRAFNRRQEYREDHGEYPPNDWLKKEKTMSHPDPRENFEDKPGDFPIIRTEIDGVTGTTRLKLTIHLTKGNGYVEPESQEL